MPENLLIEKATKSDLTGIESLLKTVNLPTDGVESFLDNFLVVRNRGNIHGSIGLETYGDDALLRSLAIHPDLQGQGLSNRLIERIQQYAKERGISSLYVLTETAVDLFKKMGYKTTKRDTVSEALLQSVEFTTLCSDATLLMKRI